MWISFFIYSVLTALLPGPNNILALNSVMQVGYKKSRTLLYGIYGGFTLLMFLSAACSDLIISSYKPLLEYLKYLGVAYLLYLAWSVATSKPVTPDEQADLDSAKNKRSAFWKGFLLQLVNVKIIIYGITAFSSFVFPHFNDIKITVVFALFLSLIGSTATWIWAMAGQKLIYFLTTHAQIINKVMAILLLYCAISLLF